MDKANIDKIARTPEDRLLLSRVWDKIFLAQRRDCPGSTLFLSPRELELCRFLFGEEPGLCSFGGHPEAERKMLAWVPEYLDPADFWQDGPLACLLARWHPSQTLTHRDLLGAILGCGLRRETLGDLCLGESRCHIFVTADMAPYLLQNLTQAGRTALQLEEVALSDIRFPPPKTQELHDTVASLRLDSVVAAGFRMGRSAAAEHIAAGRVALDGLPCEKPDRPVPQGTKISLRGQGKILLRTVGPQTKKGRISITVDRYI